MKNTLDEQETLDIFSKIAELTASLGWEVLIVSHEDGGTPGIILGTNAFVNETSEAFQNTEYELESWTFEAVPGNEGLH